MFSCTVSNDFPVKKVYQYTDIIPVVAQYENGSRVPRTGTLNRIAKALGIPPEELFCEDCRKCMFLKNYYRKKRKSHTTFDMGIEEDNSYREHKNPEDEGILYDNLD